MMPFNNFGVSYEAVIKFELKLYYQDNIVYVIYKCIKRGFCSGQQLSLSE